MHSPKEVQDLNDFSLEAISTLFEPTGVSIWSPESSGLIAHHSKPRSHVKNISQESFVMFDEGSQSLSQTSRHPPRLPNTHFQPTSTVSQSYDAFSQHSPQSRRRANSEDEDHSEDLDLDPNATDEQKRGHKRRQNTLAARRSRARRTLETQSLREENTRLKTENAIWKERALMMERLLAAHGVPCPGFST